MTPSFLALLALVGFAAGFVDAIAGGGGLVTCPPSRSPGLDPVAAVATNKLGGVLRLGLGDAGVRARGRDRFGRRCRSRRSPRSSARWRAALALPYAPRQALGAALPFVLVAIALYFALAPQMGESLGRARLSPRVYALTLAPTIGFYDGVFGPGSGSFYMIGFLALAGFGLIGAIAGARIANFGSNAGSLAVYALGGHIGLAPGLAMGAGALVGRAPGRAFGAEGRRAAGAAVDRPRQLRDGAAAGDSCPARRCANGSSRSARRDRRLTARGGIAYKRGPTGWAATRPDRF